MRPSSILGTLFLLISTASVSVRAAEETKPPQTPAASSEKVALPSKANFHLYLLIGQSNMAGRGKMTDADREPVERVLKLDKQDQWVPATHPLHFDKPKIAGVGLGLSFAEEMAKDDPDVVIGLIPCAFGGTRLERWVQGADLYTEALRRTNLAMRDGTLCGVLWHQGEGDSGSKETADTYGKRLAKMIGDLRSELGAPNLPFVVGRLGEFYIAKIDTDAIRTVDNALKTIGDHVGRAACAGAEGLKHKGDVVHFNADGLREFGRRYAAEMKNLQALGRAEREATAGRFAEAEKLLRERIVAPDAPVVDEVAVQLEILRRIRLDYSLTSEQVLEQLRESIPDVTAKDMESWRQQGVLQHRLIDGQVRYFNRAVGNLFRACPSAKARCTTPVAAKKPFDVPAHLEKLVAEAEQTGQTEVHPVKHRIRYTLRVKAGHPRLQKGAKVRCWLPFPQEYRQQGQVKLLSNEPETAVVAPNGHTQRTVYFEQTVEDPADPPAFSAEFEFVTAAYVPQLDPAKVKPYDTAGELYQEYTAERLPHVVFTPEVKKLAGEIVGEEKNPLQKARRVFRWVSKEIRWCSEMEYSTIPNLSAKAIAAREGDCGVQGMTFITLCRAAGVPARWQSGWQTKPGQWNMHDWSEFYVEPWGWLPADASNGLQKHEDERVREFFCGHMDPYRLIVNLDYGRELHPPKQSFRSEPYDFQRGEIEIDGHNLYFDEWEREIDVRTMPLDGGMASLEEALDAVVPKELKAGKVAGAVIAVGRRTETGYETWQKAYGLKQSEPQPALMTVDAIFDMASMTKPIATGTSLMILVEQGRVALDAPVGKYLPEFDTEGKRGVTVRHLMTHTSGMPPYVGAAPRKKLEEEVGFPCPDAIRDYIRKLTLTREPGKTMVYSCLNAILCEEIIEAVSGQPLNDFAAEHVFKPLGMDETGFKPGSNLLARCVPSTRESWAKRPDGFLQGQVHDPLAAMQDGVSGNAGLFSTVADLSRFAQMLLNGGELDGVRILKKTTIADMTRVQNPGALNTSGNPDRRGLLWDLYVPDPGDTGVDAVFAYGHTGYTGTAIRLYPEQGIYIIALTNRVHPDDTSSVGEIRKTVWETVGSVLMEL